jgi:ribosomal protein L35
MKLKTRKSAAKRIKSKKNYFARKKAYKAHFLRRKSSKQLRVLAQPAQICSSDLRAFNLMLPYK